MDTHASIGDRVAYWRRRRGKSQRALAGLAGVSQAYVSNVESGLRSVDKRSTLAAFAYALEVSVADLTGQPGDPTEPAKARAAACVPAIRAALVMRESGITEPAKGSVAAAVDAMGRVDYAALAPMLPGLLRGVTGADLVQVAYTMTFFLRHLGYPDLARDAARLGVAAARETQDPAWIGAAEFTYANAVPAECATTAVVVAERTADELQPHTRDRRVREMYGILHLQAALRCAVVRRGDAARAHLGEAADTAASLGEPDGLGMAGLAFGPTNVGIWSVAVLSELGEPAEAIEAARGVVPDRIPLASRQAPFYVDLGRAHAAVGGQDFAAVTAFVRAESLGPQYVRLRPTARDAVTAIYRRTRHHAVSPPLRQLATTLGIDQAA